MRLSSRFNKALLREFFLIFLITTSVGWAQNPQYTFNITYGKPKVESSTVPGAQVYTFDNAPLGTNSVLTWSGVGTISNAIILAGDQYGGATVNGNTNTTSRYNAVPVNQNTILTLNTPASYFGLWWSAGDAYNQMSFFNSGTNVGSFTTQSVLARLSTNASYKGMPFGPHHGQNASQPYAFLNFFGVNGTVFNQVYVSEKSGAGGAKFESDNWTISSTPYTNTPTLPGTPIASINTTNSVTTTNIITNSSFSNGAYEVSTTATNSSGATVTNTMVATATFVDPSVFQVYTKIYQSLATIAFNSANALNSELIQRLWGLRVAGLPEVEENSQEQSMPSDGKNYIPPSDGKDTKNPVAQSDFRSPMGSRNNPLSDGSSSHWSAFADGNGIFSQANSADALPSYNSSGGGVTAGLTYKWNENFGTGIYAGYEGTYAKYNGGSTLVDNAVNFGVFGTYGQSNGKGFYADALAGGGYNNYNVSRNVGLNNQMANSYPGAGELNALLAGGYDFKKGNWTFGPITSLQYTYLGVNPVSETGADSLDFNSSSWNSSSLLYSLGSQLAYTWKATKSIRVIPQISLSWQHEFMQNPYQINGNLGGGSSFTQSSQTPLRDTLFTGVGVTVDFGKKWDTSLFYNTSAGNSNLLSQNVFWGVEMKF